jgi:hypothetical protein
LAAVVEVAELPSWSAVELLIHQAHQGALVVVVVDAAPMAKSIPT